METKITRFDSLLGEPDTSQSEACLVQIYGPNLGKRFVLDREEITIGRGEGCEIVLELDNVSRRHCSVIKGSVLKDLGSTNGTYLNNQEIKGETPLRSGDLFKVGGAIFKFLQGSIEAQYHEEIYRLTIVDGLTQVHNKRYLIDFLDREMARCHRHQRPISVVLFDLDHFKSINDTFGHLAGDYVLREMAGTLKPRIRREECFARYGGEEFALVLPESNLDGAVFVADKLRKLIEEHDFSFESKRIPVTFSGGVAEMRKEHADALEFLKAADEKLMAAKRAGRNRVCG